MSTITLIDAEPPQSAQLIEVVSGIYWLRMPLPMALNHINLYLIDEGDAWTLLDTGMKTEETQAIWHQLFAQFFNDKPLKQVVVTHMHPDHVGLAGWLCEYWRCPMYMTQIDYFAVRAYTANNIVTWQSEAFYRCCGLGDDYIEFMHKRSSFSQIVSPMPGAFKQLKDNQLIMLGKRQWRIIVGGGHSFAHASFYNEEEGLLLAGDQIIARISSNVGVTATEPDASPLHDWYQSLERLKTLSPNTLVMPAHNKPFYGMHERADEIMQHHEHQLNVVLHECQTPKRVVDLLKPMFGRDIGFYEMSLAIGEAKAHLHMLLDRNSMQKISTDGVDWYRSTALPKEIHTTNIPAAFLST